MEPSECPPWIGPGNAFRIVVKCEKYLANLEYGDLAMAEQWHDLWVDRCSGYNLDNFVTDMASKIIWGPSQTLAVWAVDTDSDAEWKMRKNEHFEKMIASRFNERVAKVVVEVVEKAGYQHQEEHVRSRAGSIGSSGLTSHGEGLGETFTCQEHLQQEDLIVDWSALTIIPEDDRDGEAFAIADEERVFEAMGFKAADESAEHEAASEPAIPVIPAELQDDMRDASIPVDDTDPAEPVIDWDRDNPEM
ncbi:unnamed protein product, partial [Urochloa decumbens]|uniref:Uncharacterized protein n=1 Tax=Urochloa decumbens TaxID=240449 RepID=A0ABC9D3D2_9POAL